MIAPLAWWPRAFPVLALIRVRRSLVEIAALNTRAADKLTGMVPPARPEGKREYISK